MPVAGGAGRLLVPGGYIGKCNRSPVVAVSGLRIRKVRR